MHMASSVNQTIGNRLVFEDSIDVPAPVSEVYRRWTDFQHFPDFMENVEAVQPLGNNRYHWRARIFGVKQEWDAEVTDQQTNSRIAWRSTSGPFNQGSVNLIQLGGGDTQVRLRLEYEPPAGQAGRALDQITQTTRREVQEDLYNFRRLFTGTGGMEGIERGGSTSVPGLLGRMAIPAALGIAGGIAGYSLERNARQAEAVSRMRGLVEQPAAIAGWLFTAGSAASIIASAALRLRRDKTNSLFVGQWAPTLFEAGILARLVGSRTTRTPLQTAGTSWGFTAASLGAVIASAVLHARGTRNDGLFVGQWAPTLLNVAILARLIDR
jgi:uncharacterized membrane protein